MRTNDTQFRCTFEFATRPSRPTLCRHPNPSSPALSKSSKVLGRRPHEPINTGNKSYVQCTKQSNLADVKIKTPACDLLSQLHNRTAHDNDSKHKQILSCMFPSKQRQTMASNHIAPSFNIRRNLIRVLTLIREPVEVTRNVYPLRQHCNSHMRALCNNKTTFMLQLPKDIDKLRLLKTLHNSFRKMKMITMAFTTLIRYVKKMCNNDNIESIKIKSNDRFVFRRDRKRLMEVYEAATLMN